MARLKEFRFLRTDSWYQIDDGFDSILQTSEGGAVSIEVLVNLKPIAIDITDREDAFIADLEDVGVADWNQKEYVDSWVFDGDMWMLSMTYDATHIIEKGMSGYPPSFPQFLGVLHNKYGLPKAKIEDDSRISYGIKHAEISKITHTAFATYF